MASEGQIKDILKHVGAMASDYPSALLKYKFQAAPGVPGQEKNGDQENPETTKLLEIVRRDLKIEVLESAISLLRQSSDLALDSDDSGRGPMNAEAASKYLVVALVTRFACYGWIEDFEECCLLISTAKHAFFGDTKDEDYDNSIRVALELINEFRASINGARITAAIASQEVASASYTGSAEKRAEFLILLGKALIMSSLRQGAAEVLERASKTFQEAESLCLPNSPMKFICLISLGTVRLLELTECGRKWETEEINFYLKRADEMDGVGKAEFATGDELLKGDETQAEIAINKLMESLAYRPAPHPRRSISLNALGGGLLTLYRQNGDYQLLSNSILFTRESLELRPTPHPHRPSSLRNLAKALWTYFEYSGDVKDLEESINLFRELLDLTPLTDPTRTSILVNLGGTLSTRFQQTGDLQDLKEGISLLRESLLLRPHPHPLRPSSLGNLATALLRQFEHTGGLPELEEAISYFREAAQLAPPNHPDHCFCAGNLAAALFSRFEQNADSHDLAESISLFREMLTLTPSPDPERDSYLCNLAGALLTQFETNGNLSDLEESISYSKESLELTHSSHPDRYSRLNNLAMALGTRFEREGVMQDLEDSISLFRESLSLTAPTSPSRPSALVNLAAPLWTRFEQKGDLQDLEESIALSRESLSLTSESHPLRSSSLNNLAGALFTRFGQKGDLHDLEESIAFAQESLMLRPTPHPLRPSSLVTLADSYLARFDEKGDVRDLEESITLCRESLELRTAGSPSRIYSLNTLANALWRLFLRKGDQNDLEDTISLHRESLTLTPGTHPLRRNSLVNLACALSAQFKHKHDENDLEESISLLRESVLLTPAPHPLRPGCLGNLAASLMQRFKYQEDVQDLEEAIALLKDSLALVPSSHPFYCQLCYNLAISLFNRFNRSRDDADIESALFYFQSASTSEPGSSQNRLVFSERWAAYARKDRPLSALDAYRCTLSILPLLASLDLTLQQRQNVLAYNKEYMSEAARCAIEQGQLEAAVTFLSTGRSTFWSQALQLRTPVDQLASVDPDLAHALRTVSQLLETASYSEQEANTPFLANTHRNLTAKESSLSPFSLAKRRREILAEIRKLEGFEEFLLPLSFDSLRHAAVNGPIIMLNAVSSGCDALVMQANAPVQHVPLPHIRYQDLVHLKEAVQRLAQGGEANADVIEDIDNNLQRDLIRNKLPDADPTEDGFRVVLRILWNTVVEPIIQALGLEKTFGKTRIWWCPTGIFSFLPIHAAGNYDENNASDCISDYAVSSYCASPQDLIPSAPELSSDFQILAVIEPEAPGGGKLPKTIDELERIRAHVPNAEQLITHVGSSSSPVLVEDLLLDVQRSSFVHFGCHGLQNLQDPLESFLLLSGGKLTLSKIIRKLGSSKASFAYLSACQTAVSDEERPDESLNLVATMMFAGFRSVVGTMWSIFDEDAPVVADVFYRHMFRHGTASAPDITDAAYGLHLAVKELRKRGVPFRNWVPYVHFGA